MDEVDKMYQKIDQANKVAQKDGVEFTADTKTYVTNLGKNYNQKIESMDLGDSPHTVGLAQIEAGF